MQQATILSVSVPKAMSASVDALSRATQQNRSELVRSALREYILDHAEERLRFVRAFRATRRDKTMTLEQLKKRHRV